MPCKMCADPDDGMCIYPYYGLAPHGHDLCGDEQGATLIGPPVLVPRKQWPENFVETEKGSGFGVYTHCLSCGDGLGREDLLLPNIRNERR